MFTIFTEKTWPTHVYITYSLAKKPDSQVARIVRIMDKKDTFDTDIAPFHHLDTLLY